MCGGGFSWFFFFFFFQAEDGIRDKLVTGVQTCALPISQLDRRAGHLATPVELGLLLVSLPFWAFIAQAAWTSLSPPRILLGLPPRLGRLLLLAWFIGRSEERRVGQEGKGGR